ncbi:hypothetical protein SAMN05216226_10785 [Halovenus aranensis]|uniref:Uncharacterized protein n=1 Tax=Halovenus aranensis TaxID=890420 RepID=A0A1G8VPW7_9EURY|nr:hypothetical protein [Halovenus aranensis]SDJ68121.1 hypothetical protein SAMN05216226_10785 [Halovenus aranensis]
MSNQEISGQFVSAFIASAGEVSPVFERKVREYLEKNGIESVEPAAFYSLDKFSKTMHQVEDDVGTMTTMEAGREMITVIEELSAMSSLEETIDVGKQAQRDAYKNFSAEDAGQLRHEQQDDGTDRVAYYGGWRYPEGFTEGIMKEFAAVTNGYAASGVESTTPRHDEVFAYLFQA